VHGPASSPPWFRLETDGARATLRLTGSWRIASLAEIDAALGRVAWPSEVEVDGSGLRDLDSACARVLLRHLEADGGAPRALSWTGWRDVDARIRERVQALADGPPPPAAPRRPGVVAQVGWHASALARLLAGHLNFFGATCAALAAVLVRPTRLRPRELSAQLERAGLAAIPVVALVTSLIGVVLAYLLALQAAKYGASIFVVDGVAIGATREFAPVIVAVIVAGRSGAAFTAQLGSMRLTEEIDAIRTLGLDPWQVLVVPRVLALVLALPLLVFVGDVASLLGAMLVTASMLDIGPGAFVERLQSALDLRHVIVGLVKAPVFAFVIAVIGTRMGMTAERDSRAVGAATTSTVVQSIVAVILLDAAFAVVLQAMGW
jgi:phospholipid/cholesterol/gamma-HCH transport system permease protein